jgi:hypothetical protein
MVSSLDFIQTHFHRFALGLSECLEKMHVVCLYVGMYVSECCRVARTNCARTLIASLPLSATEHMKVSMSIHVYSITLLFSPCSPCALIS